MARAPKAELIDRVSPALVAEIEQSVRKALALAPAKLTKRKLTDDARTELERELLVRGLERGPKKEFRVPVEEQVGALVQGGSRVALKDVSKRVKGASRAEIDATLDAMARSGKAFVVVRTQVEVLVDGAERVLDAAEVGQLVKLVAQLGKTLKKVVAKGRKRSLLRDDLTALLTPFAPLDSAATRGVSIPTGADSPRALVAAALRRLEDPSLKLVRVADLVRSLAPPLALAAVHRALLEEADGGAIELRPEAGSEFLPDEDARLCPPGPRGTVFSYARRLTS